MGDTMTDTEKVSLIAPVVHAARRAWRFVHATGRLLPEWGECTAEQRNETFDVVRSVQAGEVALTKPEEHVYASMIAMHCFRVLFPETTETVTKPAAPPPLPDPLDSVATSDQIPPRRGRR